MPIKNSSLCWYCRHAVPKKIIDRHTYEEHYVRGCAWSIYKQPVEGWDAEKSEITGGNGNRITCYYVKYCPMFERGRK